MESQAPGAPVRRFRGQARQWSHPSRWCRLPVLLCALASALSSLALSACSSSSIGPPLGPCNGTGTGRQAPPITRYPIDVMPPPLAADGVVYVGYTVPGTAHSPAQTIIAALRQRDGALVWSVPDSNNTDHLAYADGVLLLLGQGIVGLRARDGASLWRAAPWHSIAVAQWAVGGDMLSVITDALYAFRITDGRLLWQTPVQEGQVQLTSLVMDGATVYVGSSHDFLMALRADTGALLWKTFPSYLSPPTPRAFTTYTPLAVVAGQLYVWAIADGTDSLLRVNPADGTSAAYQLPLPATTALVDPLIVNGTLYVGVGDTVTRTREGPPIAAYRLLASGGKLLWRLSPPGVALGVIAHDAQTLYLQDLNGSTYAVRLADGVVLWRQIQAFGRPADADATTGELFETVPGVVDSCNPSVDHAPQIGAFKRADGGVIWTRALDATH